MAHSPEAWPETRQEGKMALEHEELAIPPRTGTPACRKWRDKEWKLLTSLGLGKIILAAT